MSTTKQLTLNEKRDLPTNNDIVGQTIQQLTDMIIESVDNHQKVTPIYQNIQKAILEMLNKQDELANMETKDLLKLLDVTTKAQLQPVESLTKLVQATSALYDKSNLEAKVNALNSIVDTLKHEKEDAVLTAQVADPATIDADDTDTGEDYQGQSFDDLDIVID